MAERLTPKELQVLIKNMTFDKALNLLRVLNAKFIVVDADGKTHTHGDLRLAEPPPERKRKQLVPMGTYHSIYYPLVKDIKPGEGASITLPEGMATEGFRSSMGAWCSKNWGPGSYLTQIEGRIVEVLRVE
jgi:hypothetical protein